VNGDSHLDFLVANVASNTVSVLLGDGHGGFTPAAPVPVNGRDVEANDLNGDGHSEFIVSNPGNSTVSVLLNNGSGGFVAAAPGVVPQEAVNCIATIQISNRSEG
jgi:hypothetical protein